MHFPATSVATVSLVIPLVCPYEISARRFWRCGFLLLSILDSGQMEGMEGQWASDWMLAGVLLLDPA